MGLWVQIILKIPTASGSLKVIRIRVIINKNVYVKTLIIRPNHYKVSEILFCWINTY